MSALLEASYPVLMAGSYDSTLLASVLPVMTKASPELLASGTYYVAEDGDGRIVGCGGWTRERPGDGKLAHDLAHIRHFGTHPSWVRCGVGRAIFTRCKEAARSAGVCRFQCYASLNAQRFYAALGFREVRRLEVRMGRDLRLPAVLMERAI